MNVFITATVASMSLLMPMIEGTGEPPVGTNATTPATALPRRPGPLGVRLQSQGAALGIEQVLPGGVAAKSGMAPGDVIISVAGTPVASRESLGARMRTLAAGDTVTIVIQRGEATVELRATLEQDAETVEGSVVTYGSVTVPAGYRLRTIVTTPTGEARVRDGRRPAFMYVQGIICQTVDRPSSPDAVDTRIIHEMAKAGFVTMRVDKPGIGDSEGPPCHTIDFKTELEGYQAALKQLAAMPEVDSGRIFIFGHSMGGVMAPYMSAEVPVRGTIVYGTLVRTWFEYQLENVRRQSALDPSISEADITDAVLAEAKTSATVLVDKKTLGDAWARWPELRQPTQGIMLDENHMSTRSMSFFHQLQDLNLARAWERSTGAVLAVYGEYDWVTSLKDHDMIAAIVNRRTPGAGASITMPKADHAFTTHASLEESVRAMGGGEWDAELPPRMLAWIDSVDGPGGGAPTPTPAAAANDDAGWKRLATEAYPGKQDDIFFIDDKTGWYGNGAGKIFRTADGGDTWTKVWEKPGTFVRCMAFIDDKVGVMGNIGPGYFPGVTDPTPVYRTEDGGITWTPATSIEGAPVVGLCAFDVVKVPFVNAGNLDHRPRIVGVGRVGGPAAYIWSDDLGRTWKQGSIPAIGTMAFDVTFLDERRGFIASSTSTDVAASNALILATEDGGATWTEVYRSTRPYELTWKFSFPEANVGYCTIQSYDPDPAASARFVAKTVDGGRTWTEVPLVNDHRVRQFGVAFLDATTGWVGAMPHGFVTRDGGLTWSKAGFGNAVNKIRLVRTGQDVTGFAIGTNVHRLRLPAARP
ncbi:MAG: alpha/beta fold hydrolase [Phycisphaerae bacterium]